MYYIVPFSKGVDVVSPSTNTYRIIPNGILCKWARRVIELNYIEMKTTIFNVNLQQGFLMDADTIIGSFSRHNKVIYLKHPLVEIGYVLELPSELDGFKVIERLTDSFSINMYTDNGDREV